MIFYFLIALLFLVSAFIEVFSVKPEQKFDIKALFFFLVAILMILAATRQCGYDYNNYKMYFDVLHSPSWRSQSAGLSVESSFGYLCYLMPSYEILIFIYALMSIGLLFFFIYRTSPYPIFSVLLLLGLCFYSTYMGQIRQGLAMSIVMFSFISKNKWIKLALNIFACFFHITAILAFLQFFIGKNIQKTRFYLSLLFTALIINLTCYGILLKVIPMLPTFLAAKLSFYVATEDGMTLGLNMAMLLRLMIFSIFFYFKPSDELSNNYGRILNLYFISLLIYLGFGFLPQLSGRGALYFNILEILLAAKVLNEMPKTNYRYYIFFFFAAVSLYRQFSLFNDGVGYELFIPYKTWLFK